MSNEALEILKFTENINSIVKNENVFPETIKTKFWTFSSTTAKN